MCNENGCKGYCGANCTCKTNVQKSVVQRAKVIGILPNSEFQKRMRESKQHRRIIFQKPLTHRLDLRGVVGR